MKEQPVSRYAWYVLGLLTLVYLLNFLDRSLIYILFTPIKKEMQLSDLQLAMLGTTSFVIFYTLLGIPFGRLADRVVRKRLIAIGLVVWSLFSGLTGFADGFWSIFFCRVMVGVGEATLGPAALSILSDYFPPRMRATVQAIYSTGISLGGGVAFFLGGWIGDELGWRWAFYTLGFPGILVAVAVFMMREPERTAGPARHEPAGDWRPLARSVPLRYHHAGYALFALAANCITIWGPSFFTRVHDLSLTTIGTWAGLASVFAGIPGTVLGGWGADRLRARGRDGRMLFAAIAALGCIPLWLVMLFSPNWMVAFACNFMLIGAALTWLGPAAADVHEIAGARLRGLAIGVYFFTVNVIGYGIGPLVVGRLNDWAGVGADATLMRLTLLTAPIACAAGALLLWIGSRKMRTSTHETEALPGAAPRAAKAGAAAVAVALVLLGGAPAAIAAPASGPRVVGMLHVERHGKGGRPVVFVPGLACGAWIWEGAIERFARNHTVYTVTLAGMDGTAPVEGPYLDRAVASLAELIRAERLERPIVVGHSMGGFLAIRLAAEHPALVGGIVVVDALPVMPPPVPGQSTDERRAASEAFLEPWREAPADEYARQQRGFIGMISSGAAQADALAPRMLRSDRATVARAMSEMWNSDLRPALPKIGVPVLVLVPVRPPATEQSAAATRDLYAGFFAGTPRVELRTIPDARHFLMLDSPDETFDAIETFLAALAR